MSTEKNTTPRKGSAKRPAAKKGTPRVKPGVVIDVDLAAEREAQERHEQL